MQAVLRSYSGPGAKALFAALEKNKDHVEETLRSVRGFVSYTLVSSGDGGFALTVCQDKAGLDESVRKSKDWISQNAPDTGAAAPTIAEGSVIICAQ